MPDILTFLPAVFAQAANPDAAAGQQGDGGWMSFMMLIGLTLVVMWFLLVRPQQKQVSQREKMLGQLERNDKVMTVGGILATVYSVDRDKKEVVLKVDDSNNTKMRFHITAITQVFTAKETDNRKQEK